MFGIFKTAGMVLDVVNQIYGIMSGFPSRIEAIIAQGEKISSDISAILADYQGIYDDIKFLREEISALQIQVGGVTADLKREIRANRKLLTEKDSLLKSIGKGMADVSTSDGDETDVVAETSPAEVPPGTPEKSEG